MVIVPNRSSALDKRQGFRSKILSRLRRSRKWIEVWKGAPIPMEAFPERKLLLKLF
jgi:hypothetical protein